MIISGIVIKDGVETLEYVEEDINSINMEYTSNLSENIDAI